MGFIAGSRGEHQEKKNAMKEEIKVIKRKLAKQLF
jgi:hypothetical protein